jgi:hypothetical protein
VHQLAGGVTAAEHGAGDSRRTSRRNIGDTLVNVSHPIRRGLRFAPGYWTIVLKFVGVYSAD